MATVHRTALLPWPHLRPCHAPQDATKVAAAAAAIKRDAPQQGQEEDPLVCLKDARGAGAMFQTTLPGQQRQDSLAGKVLR